jgi:soluble lytic murein transglycosylase
MNAPRRLVVFLIAFAISSVSGVSLPLPQELPIPPQASLAESSAPLTGEAIVVARALGRLATALKPEELSRLAVAVAVEAEHAGLPVELVLGVISVESSGYNFAVSDVGAIGLMQLMPETAEAVAARAGVDWRGAKTLFDPVVNVRLGVDYLRQLIDRYGSVETALAAYNWGPTRIAERIRRGKPIPARYADKVLHASKIAKTALL